MLGSDAVRQWFANWLTHLNRDAQGNASRIEWLALLEEPPSIDAGEITDKGSINQRAVLQRRAALVEALYRREAPGQLHAQARP